MVLLGTAFVFGLLGSLHCLGMCAPLIWALPQDKAKQSKWWANRLAYNFGRSITYALLGLTIGLLGQTFALAGLQQAEGFCDNTGSRCLTLPDLTGLLTLRNIKICCCNNNL